MKIKILAIGKIPKFLQEAFVEYEKRVNRYCSIEILTKEIRGISNEIVQNEKENAWLQEQLKSCQGYRVIALDLKGKMLDSSAFSDLIQEGLEQSKGIAFILGGSHGLLPTTLDLCSKSISFSKMTFPHALFRVMILEQLYRAFTILNNEAYHK